MKRLQRPGNIVLELPDGFDLAPPVQAPPAKRSRSKSGPPRVPARLPAAGAGAVDDALVAAMQRQMTLVDTLDVQAPAGTRKAAAPRLEVAVAPDEDAVILVEQEGIYRWTAPDAPGATATTPQRTAGAAGARHFTIPLQPAWPGNPAMPRGVMDQLIPGRFRAWVFRFVVPPAIGRAVDFLEGDVRTGLARIRDLDPSGWSAAAGPGPLALQAGRPPRLLLFIHDVFGSTAGTFGALGATPWGTTFLEACLGHYDAVLGYEHRTLAVSPAGNASDLLAQLRGLDWGTPPPGIDIIAHGQGALVARALVERVLPASGWDARVRCAILVAGPHAGTELARTENWTALADLYTNLALGACRALALLPQAAPVATILAEALRTMGGLVKQIARSALDEQQVPGLGALRPASGFLDELAGSGDAMPARSPAPPYYVIAADFEPRLAASHEPKELPVRWATLLANGAVDRLMQDSAHDLVVTTASMCAINGIRDTLCFSRTPYIYHTNYFSRPEVVNALGRWLALPAAHGDMQPAAHWMDELNAGAIPVTDGDGLVGMVSARDIALAPVRTRGSQPAQTTRMPLPGPINVAVQLPAAVDGDIMVESAARPANALLAEIEQSAPSFVVLRRPFGGPEGTVLNYAYTPSELHSRLENAGSWPAIDALSLHETDSTMATQVSALPPAPGFGRIVAIDSDSWPVGVLPGQDEFVLNDNIDALNDKVIHSTDPGLVRRAMPSLGVAPVFEPGPAELQQPPATCHVAAEMAPSVRQGAVTPLVVTLSREAIEKALSPTAASTPLAFEVDPERKLLVDVIPKRGFVLEEDSEQDPVDLPAPGSPIDLYFRMRAVNPGKGEIRVVVRQRQLPLASLTLYPEVTPAAAAAMALAPLREEADVHQAPATSWPAHVLRITEENSRDGPVFRFNLESPSLNVQKRYRSEPVKNRESFVENTYADIETRWLGTKGQKEAFAAELQDMGAGLWDRLLPKDLREDLWRVRDGLDSIYVLSEEPFIPWELVYMKGPEGIIGPGGRFLAEVGLVRWLHEAGVFPSETLTVRPGMTRYLIPSYRTIPAINLFPLPEAEKEASFLRDEFAAVPVPPLHPDARRLLEGPAAFDLLHFAGHGFAASATVNEPQLMLEGEISGQDYLPVYLRADLVESRANFGGLRPIVVLNACQAGRQHWKLTGIGGFAQAFLRRGAGAFVGTLWSVGDAPARHFTEALYRALKAGQPLAAAVRTGRTTAQAAGDASWLAYAVYGHPAARMYYDTA